MDSCFLSVKCYLWHGSRKALSQVPFVLAKEKEGEGRRRKAPEAAGVVDSAVLGFLETVRRKSSHAAVGCVSLLAVSECRKQGSVEKAF